ncbi:MAG TPA: heterodisulfide reductase-related iron-sulfur binding cluster [bacterium]|nr:heterodisulfide reductase-related iron-sulfur binding cluster [bacterium]
MSTDVHELIRKPPEAANPRLAALGIPELDACVHCGFCLQACPTYRVTQLEPESPRGRIHLVAAASQGRIETNERFASHLYLCLMCRACETVCPSGVQYGRIAEAARELLGPPGGPVARGVLRFVLRRVLPSPRRVRVAARLLHLAQGLGVIRLASAVLPRRFREMAALLPPVPARSFPSGRAYPAVGAARGRVVLLSGCVMSVMFPEVQEATVRVLQRNGYEVVTPAGQICCGSLSAHNGETASARAMARRNIDAFLAAAPDAIIVTAAGCGATMKGYGHLLKDDEAYAGRAAQVAALTRDATEFLDGIGADPPRRTEAPLRVTYQDPCHLAHGQKVRAQPRALLSLLGADVAEMDGADRCCGSAGIYNLTHPEMSQTLLAEKMEAIRRTGAEVVVAPNPGCVLQLRYGAARHKVPVRVVHLIDLLDEAYARS